jgi:hypothetical protein
MAPSPAVPRMRMMWSAPEAALSALVALAGAELFGMLRDAAALF